MIDHAALDRSLDQRFDYRRRIESAGLQPWELALCAEDLAHWISHWCLTYDPREPVTAIPFDPFPKQREFLSWLEERERLQSDGLIEKSRDMGITYLCAAFALHHWLFRDGFSAGFGSRKLELVDRLGDPDSIFEKIRFLLYNLPDWFLPAGFERREHDNHARLVNPANGSTITGEGGDNIGRGGRKTIYFVDEAAFLERPQSVDRALSQTTRVRIDLSTPNGPGNPFATRRHSGKVPVFTFHWRDDPRKGQEWYDKEVVRLGDPVTVAQELDIDYSASIEGICIPGAWVRAAVDLDLPASGPCVAGLDVAEEGPAQCVFTSRRGPLVDNPRAWNGDTVETAYRAADCAEELGATLVAYDADGIGATVRATWKRSPRPLPFMVRPVHGGGAASDIRWPDGRLAKERFVNLRAELWWTLRTRFERTFAFVTRRVPCPVEDMISIPNHPQLIADLSLPRYFFANNGKIQIESKKDMRARGVKSPDFGDSLCYSFAPGKTNPGGYAGGGEREPFYTPGVDAPRPTRRAEANVGVGYAGGGETPRRFSPPGMDAFGGFGGHGGY